MKSDFEKLLEKVAIPVNESVDLSWKRFVNFSNRLLRGSLTKLTGIVILIFFIFIFIFGLGSDESIKFRKTINDSSDNELIKKLSELIVLPDETPIIAVVADYKKLEGNLFFKGSVNGDKLLLFQKSDKAILYDPNKNIIVNFGKVEEVGVDFDFK